MQIEECFGVKIFRVKAISFFPHFFELILATLQTKTSEKHEHIFNKITNVKRSWYVPTHGVVDFRVIGMFLLHLLIMLLFFPPALLIKCLQVFPSLVLFHHLVPFKFFMPFLVVVLQIFCSLHCKIINMTEKLSGVFSSSVILWMWKEGKCQWDVARMYMLTLDLKQRVLHVFLRVYERLQKSLRECICRTQFKNSFNQYRLIGYI